MVYISSDGRVVNKQPWGLSRLFSIFYGLFSAIMMFVGTLITPFTNPNGNSSSDSRGPVSRFFGWGSGGGGGSGGSGGSGGNGGGGSGPPRPPRRPMGRINHTPSVSFPGGCAGGSCGM